MVRRTAGGWRVGDDELPDLTCAMVLADLIAAELPTEVLSAVTDVPAPAPAAGVRAGAAWTPGAASASRAAPVPPVGPVTGRASPRKHTGCGPPWASLSTP